MTDATQHRRTPPAMLMMFAQALAGGKGPSECVLDDGRAARLERAPDPVTTLRVRLEGPDGEITYPFAAYEATPDRPAHYPADLPFVAGHRVLVFDGEGPRGLNWLYVDGAPALLDDLARQSTADGWDVEASGWAPFGATLTIRKAGATRMVFAMLLPPMVMMTEMRDSGPH